MFSHPGNPTDSAFAPVFNTSCTPTPTSIHPTPPLPPKPPKPPTRVLPQRRPQPLLPLGAALFGGRQRRLQPGGVGGGLAQLGELGAHGVDLAIGRCVYYACVWVVLNGVSAPRYLLDTPATDPHPTQPPRKPPPPHLITTTHLLVQSERHLLPGISALLQRQPVDVRPGAQPGAEPRNLGVAGVEGAPRGVEGGREVGDLAVGGWRAVFD